MVVGVEVCVEVFPVLGRVNHVVTDYMLVKDGMERYLGICSLEGCCCGQVMRVQVWCHMATRWHTLLGV